MPCAAACPARSRSPAPTWRETVAVVPTPAMSAIAQSVQSMKNEVVTAAVAAAPSRPTHMTFTRWNAVWQACMTTTGVARRTSAESRGPRVASIDPLNPGRNRRGRGSRG